ALFWPPRAIPGTHREIIENSLLFAAKQWVWQRGAKLAQTLLSPQEHSLAAPLERNGFIHVTDLCYMRCSAGGRISACEAGKYLRYQSYSNCSEQLFQEILLQSYEDSLDCPELTGLRTPAEIVAGHKVQGAHDPNRWWLVWDG